MSIAEELVPSFNPYEDKVDWQSMRTAYLWEEVYNPQACWHDLLIRQPDQY